MFKREYQDWLQNPLVDRKWTYFRNYWMDRFKEFESMNKLAATELGFGANSMAEEEVKTERDDKLDDTMDNLVAITSYDKGQAEQLIATNAELLAMHKYSRKMH